MTSNYFKVWKMKTIPVQRAWGVEDTRRVESHFIPFNDKNLEDAFRAWNETRRLMVRDVAFQLSVYRPFAFPELDKPSWLGTDIIGLSKRGKEPVRNGDQAAYDKAVSAYLEECAAIDGEWAGALARTGVSLDNDKGCRLCGGPRAFGGEFCGDQCRGRFEAGERGGAS